MCRGEFVEQKQEEPNELITSDDEDSSDGDEENPYLRHSLPDDDVMAKHGIVWEIDFMKKRKRLFPIPEFKGIHVSGSSYISDLVKLRNRKKHALHNSYATIGVEYELEGLSDPMYDSD